MYTPKKRYQFICPVCHTHGYVRNCRQNIRYCVCKNCNTIYAIDKNTGKTVITIEYKEKKL